MKKTIISTAVLMLTAIVAQAQKVTFYSPEFEYGVRTHLGLDATADIQQTQTDTITSLNLKGLEITDIRDVVYLPAIERLDLSYNEVEDVSPLLALETLKELNLSNNHLESVDVLAFIQSESLEVNVSNNYISDFSYFYTSTECDFTFVGMGMQLDKEAAYFDVYQFYADVDDDDQPIVCYRGYTNANTPISLKAGESQTVATFDGTTQRLLVPGTSTEPVLLTLTNGQESETTYAVPVAAYKVATGKSIQVKLPEGYTISTAHASVGNVDMADNMLTYTATEKAAPDVVDFSYYQGSVLKGFSRFYVNKRKKGDVNGDDIVNVADLVETINFIDGKSSESFDKTAADIDGNGTVDSTDIELIVKIIMERGSN